MTICIAGICRENNEPRIIISADKRIETYAAGADIGFKFDWACRNWPVLVAGEIGRAKELSTTYQASIDSRELNPHNILDAFRKPPQKMKKKAINDYLRNALGMTFDQFLSKRTNFPEAFFLQMLYEVRRLTLDCSLLIVGFLGRDPFIFSVNEYGSVTQHEAFATIGTGQSIADPALYQRKYRRFLPVGIACYYIYEAKRLSQIAPSVGEQTSLIIISPPANPTDEIGTRTITPQGRATLETAYANYGLKHVQSFELGTEDFELIHRTQKDTDEPKELGPKQLPER